MAMTTREVLVAARALIDTPEKWTQRTSARDAAGWPVDSDSKDAVCFCSYGAVCRAALGGDDHAEDYAVEALELENCGFIRFNDAPSTTHADILNMFDRAIAACGDA